jgi:four helix bundle protein
MASSSTSFRDLLVWQKSMDLVVTVYGVCRQLPKGEQFNLITQMQRAAVSVPANISEGSRRHHPAEFAQFIGIALGSLGELETFLELCVRLGYVQSADEPIAACQEIGRMLNGLRQAVQQKLK